MENMAPPDARSDPAPAPSQAEETRPTPTDDGSAAASSGVTHTLTLETERVQGTHDPRAPREGFYQDMRAHYDVAVQRMNACASSGPRFAETLVSAEVVVGGYEGYALTIGPIIGDIPADVRACIGAALEQLPLPSSHEGRTHEEDGYAVRAPSSVEYRWTLRATLGAAEIATP